jgi:hypothetical protein
MIEIHQKKQEIKQKYTQVAREMVIAANDPKCYRYILMRGNNHPLVQRVMDSRPSWSLITNSNTTMFDFKWTPYSSNIKFEFLNGRGQKSMVNHFEHHHCIT